MTFFKKEIILSILISLPNFLVAPAFADIVENAKISLYCAQDFICGDRPAARQEAFKLILATCKAVVQSKTCTDLIKQQPEFTDHVKQCHGDTFCKDFFNDRIDSFASCKNGFLEGTGENFVHIYEGLKRWVIDSGKSIAQKNKFIEICNHSLQCKRSLIMGMPRYEKINDKDLANYKAAFLLVERQNFDYVQSTNRRLKTSSKSLHDNILKAEELVSQRQSVQEVGLLAAAKDWLSAKNARLQCLDAKAQKEMICWGAAYLIDPTIVAGAAVKGARMAGYVRFMAENLRSPWISPEPLLREAIESPGKVYNQQIELWKMSENKKTKKLAVQFKQKITDMLESGKVVFHGKKLSSNTDAHLVELDNGLGGIWKSSKDYYSSGGAEVAAYKIDQQLELNVVPVTVHKNIDGVDGTLQLFVSDADLTHRMNQPHSFSFLDYLLNNRDRFARNYFTVQGRPVAIDHALSFEHPNVPDHFPKIDFSKEVSRELESVKIEKSSLEDLEEGLKQEKRKGGRSAQSLKKQDEYKVQIEKAKRDFQSTAAVTMNRLASLLPSQRSYELLRSTSDEKWTELLKSELDSSQIANFLERKKKAELEIEEARSLLGDGVFRSGNLSPLVRANK